MKIADWQETEKEAEMKVLIVYYSNTGNTEKLAKAIYEASADENATLARVEDVQDINGYDFIFAGFPILHHSVPGQMARLIQRFPEGTPVALFATHGCLRGGKLAIEGFYHAISLASRVQVQGTFSTQGEVNMHVMERLSGLPEYRGWIDEASSSISHPDEHDLEDGRAFASAMLAMAGNRRRKKSAVKSRK